jgi:predicted RNase H-like nuclease (RuvC/YqgF family)
LNNRHFVFFNTCKISAQIKVPCASKKAGEKEKKDKKRKTASGDCLEVLRAEIHREEGTGPGTAARRKRAAAGGFERGLAQGREEAQEEAYQKGIEEGKKIGRAIAHAVNTATNDQLLTRNRELQAELTISSRLQFDATSTATEYLVKCRQRDNKIEELERNLENEEQRSEELNRRVFHLEEELRRSKTVPATQSAQLSAALAARPHSSPYLYKPASSTK